MNEFLKFMVLPLSFPFSILALAVFIWGEILLSIATNRKMDLDQPVEEIARFIEATFPKSVVKRILDE